MLSPAAAVCDERHRLPGDVGHAGTGDARHIPDYLNLNLRLRSEVFFVLRVAAFLAEDFAPDFFGEIFFSAIPVTPFDRPR
jgi:hypothetical protein